MDQRVKSKLTIHADDLTDRSDDGKVSVSPANFADFLPWACMQMEIDTNVEVHKIVQETYIALDRKGKGGKKAIKAVASTAVTVPSEDRFIKSNVTVSSIDLSTVLIQAHYTGENLVHLKIDKCKSIPRGILRLIGLIIEFHPYLIAITIHSGLDTYSIHEICRFLPFSNITEINLDNTFIKEGNHDMMLDYSHLKVLSLSRCFIGDVVAKKIAAKLEHPLPASKSLTILNLSSNRLTDDSAKSLGRVLRTNRKLKYLNVASNMITDEGMGHILKVLDAFPLTIDEILNMRRNKLLYLKRLNSITEDLVDEFRITGDQKQKQKSPKSPQVPKKSIIDGNAKNRDDADLLKEAIYYEKAKEAAISFIGEFSDPLAKDLFTINDMPYSNGNNTLAYLNMGYNDLTYWTVKLVLKVVKHQRGVMRLPRGLVNVCLEGNPMPKACEEFLEIDRYLELGMSTIDRRGSIASRRIKARPSTDKVR